MDICGSACPETVLAPLGPLNFIGLEPPLESIGKKQNLQNRCRRYIRRRPII